MQSSPRACESLVWHVTVGAPIGPVVLDQARQSGSGRMRTEGKAESRGVEVGVHVGERGHQNPAPTIDRGHVRLPAPSPPTSDPIAAMRPSRINTSTGIPPGSRGHGRTERISRSFMNASQHRQAPERGPADMNRSASDNGAAHASRQQSFRAVGERVVVDHHKIGARAGLQNTEPSFFETGPRGVLRAVNDRLVDGEGRNRVSCRRGGRVGRASAGVAAMYMLGSDMCGAVWESVPNARVAPVLVKPGQLKPSVARSGPSIAVQLAAMAGSQ